MVDKCEELDMMFDSDNELDPLITTSDLSRYILERDTTSFFNFEDALSINLLHVNARSLKKNFLKLESLLAGIANPLSAIAISKTWLIENLTDSFFVPGYDLISKFRTDKLGGSVGIFVNSLYYFVRSDLCRMENYINVYF